MPAKPVSASKLPADRDSVTGSLPRRHAKSQQRWDRIVGAAIALFNERGFAGTSMQDISDRVELQKGSLYYYVTSKEMLLFEILRDLHQGGEALVEAINFDTSDPLGELRSFLLQICIYTGKHADRLGIFARDFRFLGEAQQKEIISERYVYRNATERLIVLAIRSGQVSANVNVSITAQAFMRAITGTYEWYRPHGPLSIEQIAVQTVGMLVLGLAAYGKS